MHGLFHMENIPTSWPPSFSSHPHESVPASTTSSSLLFFFLQPNLISDSYVISSWQQYQSPSTSGRPLQHLCRRSIQNNKPSVSSSSSSSSSSLSDWSPVFHNFQPHTYFSSFIPKHAFYINSTTNNIHLPTSNTNCGQLVRFRVGVHMLAHQELLSSVVELASVSGASTASVESLSAVATGLDVVPMLKAIGTVGALMVMSGPASIYFDQWMDHMSMRIKDVVNIQVQINDDPDKDKEKTKAVHALVCYPQKYKTQPEIQTTITTTNSKLKDIAAHTLPLIVYFHSQMGLNTNDARICQRISDEADCIVLAIDLYQGSTTSMMVRAARLAQNAAKNNTDIALQSKKVIEAFIDMQNSASSFTRTTIVNNNNSASDISYRHQSSIDPSFCVSKTTRIGLLGFDLGANIALTLARSCGPTQVAFVANIEGVPDIEHIALEMPIFSVYAGPSAVTKTVATDYTQQQVSMFDQAVKAWAHTRHIDHQVIWCKKEKFAFFRNMGLSGWRTEAPTQVWPKLIAFVQKRWNEEEDKEKVNATHGNHNPATATATASPPQSPPESPQSASLSVETLVVAAETGSNHPLSEPELNLSSSNNQTFSNPAPVSSTTPLESNMDSRLGNTSQRVFIPKSKLDSAYQDEKFIQIFTKEDEEDRQFREMMTRIGRRADSVEHILENTSEGDSGFDNMGEDCELNSSTDSAKQTATRKRDNRKSKPQGIDTKQEPTPAGKNLPKAVSSVDEFEKKIDREKQSMAKKSTKQTSSGASIIVTDNEKDQEDQELNKSILEDEPIKKAPRKNKPTSLVITEQKAESAITTENDKKKTKSDEASSPEMLSMSEQSSDELFLSDTSNLDSGTGTENSKSRFTAMMRPVAVKEPLASIIGVDMIPRRHILSLISKYCRENNLYNPENKREILFDDKLKSAFNLESAPLLKFSGLITPYLVKAEDCDSKMRAKLIKYENKLREEAGIPPMELVDLEKRKLKKSKKTSMKNLAISVETEGEEDQKQGQGRRKRSNGKK